eukprot:8178596-Pyramimonas_sp.AAC.1
MLSPPPVVEGGGESPGPSPSMLSVASGLDIEPHLMFQVKIQETGEWPPVAVPNPRLLDPKYDGQGVRVLALKKCIVSQLALPNGRDRCNQVRIYRNSKGHCKGQALKSNDM